MLDDSFYFALSVPEGLPIPEAVPGKSWPRIPAGLTCDRRHVTDLVFRDRGRALEALKLLKGAQLKRFAAKDEAESFSRRRQASEEPVARENGAEKATVATFASVAPRDLVPFRRAIEKGDSRHVLQTVWANPRFLISSGDSAVILMAGPRYNACHVAAKAGQSEALQVILETVNNPSFVRSFYVSDDPETTDSRCRVLLDCYLNTPDQGVCSHC